MESRLSYLPDELITEIADIDEQTYSTLAQLSKKFNAHLSNVWLSRLKRDFTHYNDIKMQQHLSPAGYYYFLCQQFEIPQLPSGEICITKLNHIKQINLLEKAIKKGMEHLVKHLIKVIPTSEFSEEHCYMLFKALSHRPHLVTMEITKDLLEIIKKFPSETQHNIIICGIKEFPKRNDVFTFDVVTLLFSSLPLSLRELTFEGNTPSPAGSLANLTFPAWCSTFNDINFAFEIFPHLNDTKIHEDAIYNILFIGIYNNSSHLSKTPNALNMVLNLIPDTRKSTLAKEMLDFVNAVCFENVTTVLALPQLPGFLKQIINEQIDLSNNSDSSDDEENLTFKIISETGHRSDEHKPHIYILAKTIFCLSQIVDLDQLREIIDNFPISEYERIAVQQLCFIYAITGNLNDKLINYFLRFSPPNSISTIAVSFANALVVNKIRDRRTFFHLFNLVINNDSLIETMNKIFLFYTHTEWSSTIPIMGPPKPLRQIINLNPDLPWSLVFKDLLYNYTGDIRCLLFTSQNIKHLEDALALFMSDLINNKQDENVITLLISIKCMPDIYFGKCILVFLDWLAKQHRHAAIKSVSELYNLNDPRLIRDICTYDLKNKTDIFPNVRCFISLDILFETLHTISYRGRIFQYLCSQIGSMALRAYFSGEGDKINIAFTIYEMLSEDSKEKFLIELLIDMLHRYGEPISNIYLAYLDKFKISSLYFNYLISTYLLFSTINTTPYPYNILYLPEWPSFTTIISNNVLCISIFCRNYYDTVRSIKWLEVLTKKNREEIVNDFLRFNLDLDHNDKQFLSRVLNITNNSFVTNANTISFSIWKRKIKTNHHNNLKNALIETCNNYINDFILASNSREVTALVVIKIIEKLFNLAPIANDDYHFKLAALKIIFLGLEDYLIRDGGGKFLSHLEAFKMKFPEYFSNIDDLKLNYTDHINFISNKLKLVSAQIGLTKNGLDLAAQEIVDYLAPCHFKKPFFEIGVLNTSTSLKR